MIDKLKEKLLNKKNLYYLIFGVFTTIISILSMKLFLDMWPYIYAFTASWVLAVTFSYITTRKTVYESKAKNIKQIVHEYFRFVIGRIFTYIVNFILLVIAVELLHLDEFYSNAVITVLVIILNYFVGDIMINKLKRSEK